MMRKVVLMGCSQAYLWLLTEYHTVTHLGLNPEVNNAFCKVEQMKAAAPLIKPEQIWSLWKSCGSQFITSYCWDLLSPMKFGCVPLQDERQGFIHSGSLTKMNRHHEHTTKVDPYIRDCHCKSHYSSSASFQWGKYENVKHRHEFWVCGTFPDICISGRCVDRFFPCHCILIHLLTIGWNNRSPASFYNSNLSPFLKTPNIGAFQYSKYCSPTHTYSWFCISLWNDQNFFSAGPAFTLYYLS